jgi:hypothetical protein
MNSIDSLRDSLGEMTKRELVAAIKAAEASVPALEAVDLRQSKDAILTDAVAILDAQSNALPSGGDEVMESEAFASVPAVDEPQAAEQADESQAEPEAEPEPEAAPDADAPADEQPADEQGDQDEGPASEDVPSEAKGAAVAFAAPYRRAQASYSGASRVRR